MSENFKVRNPQGLYFITVTAVDWVDVLMRPVCKGIIVKSLAYCQEEKGLQVYAYVIMSNHFHAIVSADVNGVELPNIMRDLKKFTSKRLVSAIKEDSESRQVWMLKKFSFAANRVKKGVSFKVWKDGYHPVELTSNDMMDRCLEYIHHNPVKAGLVYKPEHYVYSSAIDYSGGKGLLSIIFID